MFIDSHFHTNVYDRYEGALEKAIRLLNEQKIFVLSNTVDLDSYNLTLKIADKTTNVIPCFGLHPQMAHEYVAQLNSLENYFDNALMFGEIGLDHYFIKDETQYPAQYELLEFFFEKAQKQSKIVILHLDGAEEKGLEMLQSYSLKNAIIHGYKGSLKTLQSFIDENYFISVGGNYIMEKFKPVISDEDWVNNQSIVKYIPDDLLLIESDGPCRTEPNPPQDALRSWPTYICDIYTQIGLLRGTNSEVLQAIATNNLLKLIKNDEKLAKYVHVVELEQI
ncbi:MAG: TatD family hydrolase [Candidatus Thorarchaeota archaeon]